MDIGILEDNPAILDFLTTTLEMHGHTVHPYTFGASLLAALFGAAGVTSARPYDLVIIDLLLPGSMSGLEVSTTIRQAHDPEFPLIIISGASQDILERAQMLLPDVPVLRKPFHITALLQVIEDITGHGTEAAQLNKKSTLCPTKKE